MILCGCHPGDCHYSTGNYYARRRMTLLFSMLDYLGIERGRTRVEWVSAAEGAKFCRYDERLRQDHSPSWARTGSWGICDARSK